MTLQSQGFTLWGSITWKWECGLSQTNEWKWTFPFLGVKGSQCGVP